MDSAARSPPVWDSTTGRSARKRCPWRRSVAIGAAETADCGRAREPTGRSAEPSDRRTRARPRRRHCCWRYRWSSRGGCRDRFPRWSRSLARRVAARAAVSHCFATSADRISAQDSRLDSKPLRPRDGSGAPPSSSPPALPPPANDSENGHQLRARPTFLLLFCLLVLLQLELLPMMLLLLLPMLRRFDSTTGTLFRLILPPLFLLLTRMVTMVTWDREPTKPTTTMPAR